MTIFRNIPMKLHGSHGQIKVVPVQYSIKLIIYKPQLTLCNIEKFKYE